MKSKFTETQSSLSEEYTLGLQSYIENNSLNDDIDTILSHRPIFRRIKELSALHAHYTGSLSCGHINYYIKQQKNIILSRILGAACILLIAAYFTFALYKIYSYYLDYHNLDVSDDTFQRAVEYYEKEDYTPALLRFETLYRNEWNSTSAAHYLSSIYQKQENYDAAAEILLDYLTNRCGLVNITTDNTIYTELRDLYVNKPLSGETAEKVSDISELITNYSSTYRQLFFAIQEQDYQEADYLCLNLKSVYADGYYFVSCYSNVLVNTDRTEDAYNLIMETVRNDRTPQLRMISIRQRTSLINYILPFLNEDQQADCNAFLSDELTALNTVSDSDSAEPFIAYDDVEYLFSNKQIMHNLNYRNPLDYLTVHEETTLINAKELYCIELFHYDGPRFSKEYFYMDMKQNIYYLKDNKYLFLPVDEPSNPPAEQSGVITESYTLRWNPNIVLVFQYDENQNKQYTLKNTASKEIIFSGAPKSFSTYGAFAYFQKDNTCFTIFFTANDAVILVTKDPEQKFTYLEGRYLKGAVPSDF